jgi:hypothetical protein
LRKKKAAVWLAAILGIALLAWLSPAPLPALAQQPTGSIATVTGTPSGPTIRVDQSLQNIKVYAGPSSFDYPAVGVLLGNETAPALGRARDREDWILIYYPGVPGSVAWVWALQVRLSPGALLPEVEVPPTPTPMSTPTINPTLEAAFIGEMTATRLPTFTPPPPLDLPSFTDQANTEQTRLPTGLLIVALALVGFFGAVISYLRGR